VEGLRQQLLASSAKILELEEELTKAESLRDQCFAAEERSKELASQLEREQQYFAAKLSRLESANRNALAEVETIEAENARLKSELSEKSSDQDLDVTLKSQDEEVARLSQRAAMADSLRSENTSLALELQTATTELDLATTALVAHKQRIADLESEVQRYSAVVDKYRKARHVIGELRGVVKELEADNSRLQTEVVSRDETISSRRESADIPEELIIETSAMRASRREQKLLSLLELASPTSRLANSYRPPMTPPVMDEPRRREELINSLFVASGASPPRNEEQRQRALRSIGRIWLTENCQFPV
jgi:nucleoprotein TPR